MTDFTIKQWSFKDTTAKMIAVTAKGKARLGGACSANIIISAVPLMVTKLTAEGYTVNVK